jgi:anti-sigma B factor antagonist
MDIAIGVFDSRGQAEKAVKELRVRGVRDDSIVFMSPSEIDANSIAKEFGAYVAGSAGAATGVTTGAVAASIQLPGATTIFAVGFGAAALLGVADGGTDAKAGSQSAVDGGMSVSASAERPRDETFLREALTEGRSLIVVRANSSEISKLSSEILDRLGLGFEERSPIKMQSITRQVGDVTVVDVSGRITLGEGSAMLRDIARDMENRGIKKIVLNLGEVQYIDSSGVNELVRIHTTVKNFGGQLRLASLKKRMNDLLHMTKLSSVFDIAKDEDSAIRSMHGDAPRQAVA